MYWKRCNIACLFNTKNRRKNKAVLKLLKFGVVLLKYSEEKRDEERGA